MEDKRKKWEEEMEKWNKRLSWILVITLIFCLFGVLDIWHFRIEGNSVIHPYLALFLTVGSLLLSILAIIAKITARKYFKKN